MTLETIVDFANSADCFPGVTIAGGICYFLWGLEYNGECKIINMNAGEEISSSIRKLNEYPVFVRNNIAIQIIRKVNKVTKNYLDMIASICSARKSDIMNIKKKIVYCIR